jgi:hypothetical protein
MASGGAAISIQWVSTASGFGAGASISIARDECLTSAP